MTIDAKVTEFLRYIKLATLVVVNGLWESKCHDKVIVQFIRSSFGGFVTGSICLSKSSVMIHDYQDILMSSRAWFKMNIIRGDKLERSCGAVEMKLWLKLLKIASFRPLELWSSPAKKR